MPDQTFKKGEASKTATAKAKKIERENDRVGVCGSSVVELVQCVIEAFMMIDALNNQSEIHRIGDSTADPLSSAIKEFRDGLADYNANAPQDDRAAKLYAAVSFRTKRQAIVRWVEPALTRRGAVDALRLAEDAGEDDDFDVVMPMIRAALCYLETIR